MVSRHLYTKTHACSSSKPRQAFESSRRLAQGRVRKSNKPYILSTAAAPSAHPANYRTSHGDRFKKMTHCVVIRMSINRDWSKSSHATQIVAHGTWGKQQHNLHDGVAQATEACDTYPWNSFVSGD